MKPESLQTSAGLPLCLSISEKYFCSLVDRFFKILPIREKEEESLPIYLQSLQLELIGCQKLIVELKDCGILISLLSILQFFIDNPSSQISVYRREVFRAIGLCNKLKTEYTGKEV